MIRLNSVAAEHGGPGQPDDPEQPGDPAAVEDRPAVELELAPPERLEEPLEVVDRAGGVGDVPQQHAGRQQHAEEHQVEDQGDLEHAPRVDVADDPGDLADPRAGARRCGAPAPPGATTSWS